MTGAHNRLPAPVVPTEDDSLPALMAALKNPEQISPDAIASALAQSGKDTLALRRALAFIGTALMLAPKLARQVPLSFLERCRRLDQESDAWQALALIMLHTDRDGETVEWLKSIWQEEAAHDPTCRLLGHLCDWFPERIDGPMLARLAKRNRSSPQIMKYQETQLYRERVETGDSVGRSCLLTSMFGQNPRILVVHNIVDGQGDEMIRVYALLQALLDGFPDLEITLFTDRLCLYDHPRLHALSISDTDAFSEVLKQPWHGIIDFYEPGLPSGSYNAALERLFTEHLKGNQPRFYLQARKDINHFAYESLRLDGQEFAFKFGITRLFIRLTYEITMRLIKCLGLPLRVGEEQPKAGAIQTTNLRPDLEKAWQDLTGGLKADGRRLIAVVGVFGGQHPLKGFTQPSFDRLAKILQYLVDEGYGLVLTPNGKGWGDAAAMEAVRDSLDPRVRQYVVAAPILPNAQENMRQLKYFVAWSDLVVTIEGWMMHLAYALGKPFRLLAAPCSNHREWSPHGRSANQRLWLPPIDRSIRNELALLSGAVQAGKPLPIHYPEKDMLEAAFELWSIAGSTELGKSFSYWMDSDDRDIRKWVVALRGEIDPAYFHDDLINALSDRNRKVRAAAATALLDSGQDLTEEFSSQWRQVLQAYQLIGESRFGEAQSLGRSALRAIQACFLGEEGDIQRRAAIAMEAVSLE